MVSNKSKSALEELVERTPKRATVKAASGEIIAKEIEEITVGEVLIIKPSDMIALDAEITKGSSSIDESTITGEPIPRGKHPGDPNFRRDDESAGLSRSKGPKNCKRHHAFKDYRNNICCDKNESRNTEIH